MAAGQYTMRLVHNSVAIAVTKSRLRAAFRKENTAVLCVLEQDPGVNFSFSFCFGHFEGQCYNEARQGYNGAWQGYK